MRPVIDPVAVIAKRILSGPSRGRPKKARNASDPLLAAWAGAER